MTTIDWMRRAALTALVLAPCAALANTPECVTDAALDAYDAGDWQATVEALEQEAGRTECSNEPHFLYNIAIAHAQLAHLQGPVPPAESSACRAAEYLQFFLELGTGQADQIADAERRRPRLAAQCQPLLPDPAPVDPELDPEPGPSASSAWGWVSVGTATAAAAAGAVLLQLSFDSVDDARAIADEFCAEDPARRADQESRFNDLKAEATRYRVGSIVAFSSALALGVTGAILLTTTDADGVALAPTIEVVPDRGAGFGLSLQGRF